MKTIQQNSLTLIMISCFVSSMNFAMQDGRPIQDSRPINVNAEIGRAYSAKAWSLEQAKNSESPAVSQLHRNIADLSDLQIKALAKGSLQEFAELKSQIKEINRMLELLPTVTCRRSIYKSPDSDDDDLNGVSIGLSYRHGKK
ncbi:hypothetical protein KBC04_05160 [Candidatus Babeliales bacterium]|nr:hypothetical protein [Candidatus Babeliales bacterium]MBP9844134.1 hypothetical protein [Candidatus Babeliales bacterium]